MADGLTPRQSRFVEEYLVDLNATQAALRTGYSPHTAPEQASRLLSKAKVQEAVQHALEARSERVQITQDDVVRGLHREATLDGEGASHGARVAAWTALGKHLAMFTDKTQQTVDLTQKVISGDPLTKEQWAQKYAEDGDAS